MPKLKMYNTSGAEAGEITLADEIFGATVNEYAIHQVVVAQLAAARQGTQSTLTRREVRGGGIKPWRQKGSGRARHGSIRSPQWTKGGVVFAPKPRSYVMKINKKVKRLAMLSALSAKTAEQSLLVLDGLVFPELKTKEAVKVLKNLKVGGKALIITADKDDAVLRVTNNLQNVKTAHAGAMNVYDIVNCDSLIITEAAARRVEEVYA